MTKIHIFPPPQRHLTPYFPMIYHLFIHYTQARTHTTNKKKIQADEVTKNEVIQVQCAENTPSSNKHIQSKEKIYIKSFFSFSFFSFQVTPRGGGASESLHVARETHANTGRFFFFFFFRQAVAVSTASPFGLCRIGIKRASVCACARPHACLKKDRRPESVHGTFSGIGLSFFHCDLEILTELFIKNNIYESEK